MSQSTPAPSPDPRLAQALDAAERRLVMLDRLAEMGMAVATAVNDAVVEFPHRPGSGPQGARAFAQVSRAVRLTLMLAARTEKSILAMRKGELGLEAALDARDAADPSATRAERLRERDDAGAFLSQPFHDCVRAICADLGLDPETIVAMEGSGGAFGSNQTPAHPGERRNLDHRAKLAEAFDST